MCKYYVHLTFSYRKKTVTQYKIEIKPHIKIRKDGSAITNFEHLLQLTRIIECRIFSYALFQENAILKLTGYKNTNLNPELSVHMDLIGNQHSVSPALHTNNMLLFLIFIISSAVTVNEWLSAGVSLFETCNLRTSL